MNTPTKARGIFRSAESRQTQNGPPCIQRNRKIETKSPLKAYVDLTRAHISHQWPLLFCSGLMLAFQTYGGFSWSLTTRAALIGLFGFEAGVVLNDYVDREIDKLDLESDKLGRHLRFFGKRPLASGLIRPRAALGLFLLFVILSASFVATLPNPNRLYVFLIMAYCYSVEYFYHVRRRNQRHPFAQLLGRTDFALFPVAGYLCFGYPDRTAVLYFLFFYLWVMAHLGLNDLADIRNDEAKGLKTIAVLYGAKRTAYWILLFSLLHLSVARLLLMELGSLALVGFVIAFSLIVVADYLVMKEKNPRAGSSALPMFHTSLMVYVAAVIIDYAFGG